jgi:hypothetical protein
LIWAEAYLLAGRFFGDIAKKSVPFIHVLGHFAGALFILMVVGFFTYRVVKQRKFLANVRGYGWSRQELMAMIDEAEDRGVRTIHRRSAPSAGLSARPPRAAGRGSGWTRRSWRCTATAFPAIAM